VTAWAAGGVATSTSTAEFIEGLTHLISFPDLNDGGVPWEYWGGSQGILRNPRSEGAFGNIAGLPKEYYGTPGLEGAFGNIGWLPKEYSGTPGLEGAFGNIAWLPKEYYGNPGLEEAFGNIGWLPKEYSGNFGWPKRNSSVFQNQVLIEHQDKTAT